MKLNEKWYGRFLNIAKEVASWSKDKSSKIGCVIVDSNKSIRTTGYNGLPRNVDDTIEERHERPEKYKWFNHAETNAINNCARIGTSTDGCILIVTHAPCSACSRNIIQSGISEVIIDKESFSGDFISRWGDEWKVSETMFKEAGVKVVLI